MTPPPRPALAANAGTWLAENWQTLALVGVGLLSLLMLRSMVRSPAGSRLRRHCRQPRPARSAALAVHEPPADDDEPEPVKVLKRPLQLDGPDLKAELREIVKENPDAAATILRSWIGEAA